MFSAIILPRRFEPLVHFIEEKNLFYPATSNYFLCIANREVIPRSIKERLREVVVDTGFVSPVRAFQHYEYLLSKVIPNSYRRSVQDPELVDDFVVNRELMALRSKLSYAVAELLAPTQFYVQLENPVNSTGTRRLQRYRLYYNEIPCYWFDPEVSLNEEVQPPDVVGDYKTIDQTIQSLPKLEQSLFDELEAITSLSLGPLVCSTRTLTLMRNNPPRWYIRECLRDICEFKEIEMKDKVLMEGPSTGELYLFYKSDLNLTEEQQIRMINEIRGNITSSMRARIFPRRTPDQFVKSRRLVKMANGQWRLPVEWIAEEPNLFKEEIEISFTFRNADDLFWFLLWLSLCPTYSFIEKELMIFVQETIIQVRYRTSYYPDYLRVMSARRVKHNFASSGKGQILYPGRLTEEVTTVLGDRPFIQFYDNERNDRAVVALEEGDLYLPTIERTAPLNYSLDSRIKYDPDPIEVS
uniref:Uncharacterized protein n=1 Tax=viral metagenome TaxID=1070528 RepID=A0A6C0IX29_9ZZZZ